MPFIVSPIQSGLDVKKLGVNVDNPNIIAFATRKVDGDLLMSLQNYADEPQSLNLKSFGAKVMKSDFWSRSEVPISGEVIFPAKGIRHFKVIK